MKTNQIMFYFGLVIFILLSPILHAIKYAVDDVGMAGQVAELPITNTYDTDFKEVKIRKPYEFKRGDYVRLRKDAVNKIAEYGDRNWNITNIPSTEITKQFIKDRTIFEITLKCSRTVDLKSSKLLGHVYFYPISAIQLVHNQSKRVADYIIEDFANNIGATVRIANHNSVYPNWARGRTGKIAYTGNNLVNVEIVGKPSGIPNNILFWLSEIDHSYGIRSI